MFLTGNPDKMKSLLMNAFRRAVFYFDFNRYSAMLLNIPVDNIFQILLLTTDCFWFSVFNCKGS
jgi:hypothetical protein